MNIKNYNITLNYTKIVIYISVLSFIFIFPAVILAALPSTPSAPSILINRSYAFKNVLETDDQLYIAAYYINDETDEDGSWEEFRAGDAVVRLIDEEGSEEVIKEKSVPRLGGGIVAFYFNASSVPTPWFTGEAGDPLDMNIQIISNPSTFSDTLSTGDQGLLCSEFDSSCIEGKVGRESDDDWIFDIVDGITKEETKEELEDRLIDIFEALENIDPSLSLLEADRGNADAAEMATDAIPFITTVAPGAFNLSQESLSETFAPGTNELQSELDSQAGDAKDSLFSFATELGLNEEITSFAFIAALTATLFFSLLVVTESQPLAATSIGSMLVLWTSLSLISTPIILILAIACWAVLGAWLSKLVPTS